MYKVVNFLMAIYFYANLIWKMHDTFVYDLYMRDIPKIFFGQFMKSIMVHIL